MRTRSARAVAGLALAAVISGCAAGRAAPPRQTALLAVSCAAPGACLAVGQQALRSSLEPLSERLSRRGWRPVAVPAVGRSSQLLGVSCPIRAFCMAVGSEPTGALSEVWDGRGWQRRPVPRPAGLATLDAVSCLSAGFCIAVGATRHEQALIERWDGATWTRMQNPGSANPEPSPLHAVSCTSPAVCVAVGTTFAPNGRQSTLVERYSGGAWHALVADSLAAPSLAGVSCLGAGAAPAPSGGSWCLAVGATGAGASRAPLALEIDGSAIVPESPPALSAASFTAVSCTAIADCVAVGAQGSRAGFSERFANGGWSRLRSSARTGAGVSCAGAGSCVAVGSGSHARATVGRIAGGVWRGESLSATGA
jgi:hypothetical protein